MIDWGRRRLARLLEHRDFGSPDLDAITLFAVVETFGADQREPVDVETAVRVIRRGLLGEDR